MAYNNYFPQTYQSYPGYNIPYQNQMMQNMQNQQAFQQMQPQMQQQAQPQIQNGGFVSVRSIEEAFNYPVAPGNSITFKDENAPYVYTKTKGFSQLEQPVFEKYRLVKEEDIQQVQTPVQAHEKTVELPNYDKQINDLWMEINGLKARIEAIPVKEEKTVKKTSVKKEVNDNE